MPRPLVLLAALAVLCGCGVPTGDAPEEFASSDVPFELLSPVPTTAAPPSVPPVGDQPRVHFVSPDQVLVPTGREVADGSTDARLADLLDELGAGPTADELDDQLTTALPPGAELSLVEVDGDTVTVDLTGPGEAPSGVQSRLAVAQIVLTATSLPEIRSVLLTSDGDRLEAPLPSGELTAEPLQADDVGSLLVRPPS